MVRRIMDAVEGGVDMVQLREKDLPGGRLLELAERLRESVGDSALLVINERVDVAVACGADGVQLGEEAIPTAAARAILGPKPIIGRSVHSQDGAAQAADDGADYLIVGTVFASLGPDKYDASDTLRIGIFDSTEGESGSLVPVTDLSEVG